jgi:hypothetical protein
MRGGAENTDATGGMLDDGEDTYSLAPVRVRVSKKSAARIAGA